MEKRWWWFTGKSKQNTPENTSHERIPDLEREPQFADLTLFTSTFYGSDESSKLRQKLALLLFKNAQKLGVKCVVVDGGSNREFLDATAMFDNVILQKQQSPGMGPGRREALQAAMNEAKQHPVAGGEHYFMWIEPEKEGLVSVESLTKLLTPLRDDATDIVVPARDSMETLPKFQAWMEKRANKRAMELVGDDVEAIWDLWFGPKVFNTEGADYFLNYKGDLDMWDSIIKPVLDAYRDGKRIMSVPINFTYTEEQRGNEERRDDFKIKRIEQYAKILAEMGNGLWKTKISERVGAKKPLVITRSDRKEARES